MKPGLVASYDIRPGNGEGLIWFRCFIKLSLTYLFKHLPTYLQPRTHTWLLPSINLSCVNWVTVSIFIKWVQLESASTGIEKTKMKWVIFAGWHQSYLQWFNNAGWVTERHLASKDPAPIIPKGSLSNRWSRNRIKGQRANPGLPEMVIETVTARASILVQISKTVKSSLCKINKLTAQPGEIL